MKKSAYIVFAENNECVDIQNFGNKYIVKKCWGANAFVFEFPSKQSMAFLKDVILHKELFAIYHKDKKMYEFIFSPTTEQYTLSFDYIYDSKQYHLYYDKPSDEFVKLIKYFELTNQEEIDDRAMGLLRYQMYYQSPELEGKFFPNNFFIKGEFDDDKYSDALLFFKHVNFVLSYYDRESPNIIINDNSDARISDINVPCLSAIEKFPKIVNTHVFDTTLLELMNAAKNTSSIRLKFIFYFQVLEYCSYYYIENNLKRKISNIIKSPDILNADKYSQHIIEIYSEYFKQNKDDKRMDRLVTDLCTYDDIKNELLSNSKYFIDDICFEGGLSIKGMFNTLQEIESTPPKDIMQTIRRNLETIRNVLVHARESRENVVIKPTPKNSELLRPYLYLIRRIAEIVIIKYE